jgi:hypothetical protein
VRSREQADRDYAEIWGEAAMAERISAYRAEGDELRRKSEAAFAEARRLEGIAEEVRLAENAKTPVDRAQCQLSGGSEVTADHRELKPNGQQQGYIVLTPEERAKGFVRPVRRTYIHTVCGNETRMSQDIAETYARDPGFYTGTFCVGCGKHLPLVEFVWKDNPDQQVGS